MSCLCCVDKCTQLARDVDVHDEPLVDIDRIIKQIAWQELSDFPPSQLTWRERLCPLAKVCQLEVDSAFVQVWPRSELTFTPTVAAPPGSSDVKVGAPRIDKGTTVLFKSSFENNTESAQTYSFRTERQTRSFVEMSLQRGFTMGNSLEVSCKIPTGPAGEDSKFPTVCGKLGGQLQWSFQRGKTSREEDQVTWSVDNNIVVGPKSVGTAQLMVTEYKWSSDFTLPCEVRALPHPAPGHLVGGQAGRAAAILDGKKDGGGGGSTPGGINKGPGGAGGGGGDGPVDGLDTGRGDDDRERMDEEEEDEVEREEMGVLTAATQGKPDGAPPGKVSRPKIPVFVRRKSNGDMLKVIYVPCAKLVHACPEHFRQDANDAAAALCDLRGRCHMVCATEQRVRLAECMLAPAETPPAESALRSYSYRDRYMP